MLNKSTMVFVSGDKKNQVIHGFMFEDDDGEKVFIDNVNEAEKKEEEFQKNRKMLKTLSQKSW